MLDARSVHLEVFCTGQKPIGHGIMHGELGGARSGAATPARTEMAMSDQSSIREQLKRYREELFGIEPTKGNWPVCSAWIAKVRPFIRRHFPSDLSDFNNLARTPDWRSAPVSLGPRNDRAAAQAAEEAAASNTRRAEEVKSKLLALLDGLLQLTPDSPGPSQPGEAGYMPFRPYKRLDESTSMEDVFFRSQMGPIRAAAEEKELRAIGGQGAVLASIRQHLPTFDPTEAQRPYAPAWLKLKPILVRAGLTVDEATTLTDIKAFLDATPPPAAASQAATSKEAQAVPDPKRVFVIYGRNTAAYDQMVKFLRALKLDPRGFFDVSADCGANPSVLQIVRHGMEQAAGVVALFTPDEWAVLRPELDPGRGTGEEARRWQARPNVLFEAGLALGIAEDRTILVRLGRTVSLFSDVGGIHTVNLDNGHESRNLLRGKLRAAGCQPDMETGDHLSVTQAGDFVTCVDLLNEQAPGDPFLAMAPATKRARGKK